MGATTGAKMSKKRDLGPCAKGCEHNGKHAVGWGPDGRKEWCVNASACLNVFLADPKLRNAEQSHCPPKCTFFMDEQEL